MHSFAFLREIWLAPDSNGPDISPTIDQIYVQFNTDAFDFTLTGFD